MIPAEREAIIIEELKANGVVTVEELAEKLNVTPMTIRRDLTRLEKQGLLYRSHGGAVLTNPMEKEQLYDVKKMAHTEEKHLIAKAAAELVKDGDTVLLDAGTTTYELALLLKQKREITVVTTDLKIALELSESDVRLFIIGGQIQRETGSALGALAEEFLNNIKVDVAFIGTSAISRCWNVCTPTPEKAAMKRKMIQSAGQSVLLADSSKFYKDAFVKICSLSDIEKLITDKHFSPEEADEIEATGIEVLSVG